LTSPTSLLANNIHSFAIPAKFHHTLFNITLCVPAILHDRISVTSRHHDSRSDFPRTIRLPARGLPFGCSDLFLGIFYCQIGKLDSISHAARLWNLQASPTLESKNLLISVHPCKSASLIKISKTSLEDSHLGIQRGCVCEARSLLSHGQVLGVWRVER
jgi:hypothetical protein